MDFPASFVLRGVNVLTPTGDFDGPKDVVVTDGIVAEVSAEAKQAGLVSFDLSGAFLTPGFFDCHVHLTMSSTDPLELMQTPLTLWALRAARNAEQTLRAGFTSVRDAGGADAGLRTATDSGLISGPRLKIAVVLLSQTGGHADGFLTGPAVDATAGYLVPDYPGRPEFLVDGPESMRRAVRAILRAGGDWIKLCTTGGFNSPHDDPQHPELTFEEVSIAVTEAARKGKGVMAHAFGGEGIDVALQAGVRSIEHGTFMSESQAEEMAARGCWFVPTLSIQRDVLDWAARGQVPDYFASKTQLLQSQLGSAVRLAKEHGVPIAVGTDFFRADQHGSNLRELAYLCEAGLTAGEALLAATVQGARLCGVADRLGLLAPGYVFDAVVLDSEPRDASSFLRPGLVQAVFKQGRPVVPHPAIEALA